MKLRWKKTDLGTIAKVGKVYIGVNLYHGAFMYEISLSDNHLLSSIVVREYEYKSELLAKRAANRLLPHVMRLAKNIRRRHIKCQE